MSPELWWFSSIACVALALVPAGQHLAELPHKFRLPAHDYLVVQQLYAGWSLFGTVICGALLSTGVLRVLERREPRLLAATSLAFLCILGTQIVFWVFTQPVNRATRNWTVLPDNWMQLRNQWEYSHAASAVLNLIALFALLHAAFSRAAGLFH
jgi:branched-subunit amino acid ABC-type transport system permease component